MPIYVYTCDCGTKVERPQSVKKRNIAPLCQDCGKKMKIQIQPAGLVFKGGGWTNKEPDDKRPNTEGKIK